MFNGRKSLMIALSVVMMLAMVVPAAMAAPEVLHGISVVSPTTGKPAYIGAGASGTLYVEFDVTIGLYQVDDVWVKAELIDKSKDVKAWDYSSNNVLANQLLNDGVVKYRKAAAAPDTGLTPLTFDKAVLAGLNEGWYDLKVCAMEADIWPETWLWCDTEENAFLVDTHAPGAWLDKPGVVWPPTGNPAKGVWLTDQEYLVGGGQDVWGLKGAEFQYCAITNFITFQDDLGKWDWKCGANDASWIKVSDGAVSGVINEYGGTEYTGNFDTTMVPDDEGVVRICVWDLAGNKSCDYSVVWIDNEFSINLRPGWNLISTPTALYDDDIEDVLHHLLVLNKVGVVYSYDKCGGCGGWKMFDPGAGPDSLTTIEPGKGYWIWMNGEATGQLPLTFWGTWKQVGNNLPQSISVFKGWNLLGYVQWGRPTAPFFAPSLAGDYLANIMTPIPGVGGGVQALVKYNALTGLYEAAQYWDPMELGKGYWMATDTDGTIYPAQW